MALFPNPVGLIRFQPVFGIPILVREDSYCVCPQLVCCSEPAYRNLAAVRYENLRNHRPPPSRSVHPNAPKPNRLPSFTVTLRTPGPLRRWPLKRQGKEKIEKRE